jgi:hypothetical protein
VVVGDSITALTRPFFTENESYIDGEAARGPTNTGVSNNLTANETIDRLAPLVPSGGWLVVQEAGDHPAETVQSYRAFVDRTAAVLPDDRCLAWVTPFDTAHVERDAAYTAEIREGITAQPCHVVVEWADAVDDDPGAWLADGLHPNPNGAHLLASMIEGATP